MSTVFGLLVSIPLVIAGSRLIMKLIERYPGLQQRQPQTE